MKQRHVTKHVCRMVSNPKSIKPWLNHDPTVTIELTNTRLQNVWNDSGRYTKDTHGKRTTIMHERTYILLCVQHTQPYTKGVRQHQQPCPVTHMAACPALHLFLTSPCCPFYKRPLFLLLFHSFIFLPGIVFTRVAQKVAYCRCGQKCTQRMAKAALEFTSYPAAKAAEKERERKWVREVGIKRRRKRDGVL